MGDDDFEDTYIDIRGLSFAVVSLLGGAFFSGVGLTYLGFYPVWDFSMWFSMTTVYGWGALISATALIGLGIVAARSAFKPIEAATQGEATTPE